MRYEVIAKDEKSATILTTTNMGGQINKAKTRYVLNSTVKTVDKTITIAGKQLKVQETETYTNGKLTSRIVMSKDLPMMGGIVRNEDGKGNIQMQLKDFKKQ